MLATSCTSRKTHFELLPSPSGNFPTGKTRGLVVRMECNDNLASHHERNKRPRHENSTVPPHCKDPTLSNPESGCKTHATSATVPLLANNSGSLPDLDQDMDEPSVGRPNPNWGDVPPPPPCDPTPAESRTQTELLESLHRSLASAKDTLNKMSIHAVLPERTINIVQDLYHRATQTKSPESQEPPNDILDAIRRLAKDVEELKRATPPSATPTHPPPKPKEVFATGPSFKPTAKTPNHLNPPHHLTTHGNDTTQHDSYSSSPPLWRSVIA